jgi:putative protein-disulfide isomerase
MMSTTTLHYIYDPLCGWCYGATPLVKAAREVISVQPHGGGMMAGPNRQTITPQLRAFVKQHDERIARQSGQHFGEAYRDGLLNASGAVLDSEPLIAAILAAETIAGRGLDMLAQLQIAHYVEGRQIADGVTLTEVATTLGIHPTAFAESLDRQSGLVVRAHIFETRQLMARLSVHGFPCFVLETDGAFRIVDNEGYWRRPQDFQDWLRNHSEQTGTSTT